METGLFQVRKYIKARTPDALIAAQLTNNIKHGKTFNYTIIYADGVWFAWYLDSAEDLVRQKVREVTSA